VQKVIGLLVIVLGTYLIFKVMFSAGILFLLIAAALAVGAATGLAGRWAYGLAAVFGLVAVPALAFRTIAFSFAILFKLAPFLLVAYGIYIVLKAFK